MKLKPVSVKYPFRLALAFLFGLSLSIVVWMLALPQGFISKLGLALAVLSVLILTAVFYKILIPFYIRARMAFKFRWGILAIIALLLTGIAYQLVIVRQTLIFPFTPKQTLAITLQSDSMAFRPVNCELNTLYSSQFQTTGDLVRVDSGLMTLTGAGSTLTWRGWTGSACTFTLVNPPEGLAVEITWSGEATLLKNLPQGLKEYPTNFQFEVPLLTGLTVAGILALAVPALLLAIICIYLWISKINKKGQEEGTYQEFGKRYSWLIAAPLVLLLVVLFLRFLYAINLFTKYPSRDSGVFLYIGQGLLAGGIPYLDYWDHKGPLIYFINALGKVLDPAGEWGIFALQVVFLLITSFLVYRILLKHSSRFARGIGLCAFFYFVYSLSQGGNLVEFYSLLFLTIGLATGLKAIETGKTWPLLFFGISASLTFSLRPNLVSIFIVTFIVWAIETIKKNAHILKGIALTFTGVLLILVPFAIFFVSKHAMKDLLDQVFGYNFVYAGSNGLNLWEKITRYSPITLPVVLLGLIGLLFIVGIRAKNYRFTRENNLLTILTFSFLLEIVLSQISGFDFPHYLLPLALIVTMISILFFDLLNASISNGSNKVVMNGIVILALLGLNALFITEMANYNYTARKMDITPEIMEKYINPQQSLLIWGAESGFNYLVGISSPTRYIYQYPLVSDNYCSEEKGQEFLQDIAESLPMVIDATISNTWMPPLAPYQYEDFPKKSIIFGSMKCLSEFYDFFVTHYEPVYTIPENRWTIYMPNDSAASQD